MPIYQLSDEIIFPHPSLANSDGILAVGGDLSAQRLVTAYANGIFPWYNEDEPILWWAPDPRFVLFPDELRIPKSMKRVINQNKFKITYDVDFYLVIKNCREVRQKVGEGTWITDEMMDAYIELHQLGFAHSVEAWNDDGLVGGLYGVSLGRCFCGESMFAHTSNASKTAFIMMVKKLQELNFLMIDSQVHTGHLERFGARHISLEKYLEILKKALEFPTYRGNWNLIPEFLS